MSSLQYIRRLFQYALQHKKIFYFGCMLAISIAFIAPVRPRLIKYTLSDQLGNTSFMANSWEQISRAIFLVFAAQIGILIIEGCLRLLFNYNMAKLGQNIVYDLRKAVYERILSFRMPMFDKIKTGHFTTRVVNDIEVMNAPFSEGFIPMIADILSILSVLVSMFMMDWKVSFISLSVMPLVLVSAYGLNRFINRSYVKVRAAISRLNAFVQEHLSGITLIQIFGVQNKTAQELDGINNDHRKAHIQSNAAFSVFYPLIEIISALGLATLLYFTLTLEIDAGKFIFFFLSLNQIFRPIRHIAHQISVVQMSIVSAGKIFEVLDNPQIIKDPPNARRTPIEKGTIVFNNVSFSYNQKKVLKNINLSISAGEKIALVGHTGQGKTTLIQLINRLYDPDEGRILIDGHPVSSYALSTLREHIAIIPQNVFLFSTSVYQNISLGNPHITRQSIEKACHLIGLDPIIQKFPKKYQHLISESGANLSAGERQLICLARALVHQSPILIMDEATASMDYTTEQLVDNALKLLSKNRTCIIIAHRLSTIQCTDRIIFIEKGRIAEEGTHQHLYEKKGAYYNLLQAQECRPF